MGSYKQLPYFYFRSILLLRKLLGHYSFNSNFTSFKVSPITKSCLEYITYKNMLTTLVINSLTA